MIDALLCFLSIGLLALFVYESYLSYGADLVHYIEEGKRWRVCLQRLRDYR